jgi:hypothetical protein
LTIVALAILLAATPGLAAAQGWRGGASFNVLGTITTLNSTAGTIAIKVATPLYFHNTTITVQTATDTQFKECEDDVHHKISFEDLVPGRQVRISGVVIDGTYFAASVIQYVSEE